MDKLREQQILVGTPLSPEESVHNPSGLSRLHSEGLPSVYELRGWSREVGRTVLGVRTQQEVGVGGARLSVSPLSVSPEAHCEQTHKEEEQSSPVFPAFPQMFPVIVG